MHWINEHLGSLALLACSLTTLVLVYSWGDGISPLAVIKKSPSALRLVAGGLFILGTGNFVMWAPGVATMLVGEQWFGEWGKLLVWPGLLAGFYVLTLIHKPLLAMYRVISGVDD
ncbi:hypothetical protein [Sphingobium phenoxybenzoativorans]|uniref:hypothetical protein n=1 Tax=Sphingobium phenoxybenzoativorans TaxID=1592790 RepID=UPI000A62357D|nr:hypothetical protein [Sphingobium phenoxybenzoativorans]